MIGTVTKQELRSRTHWAAKARKFDGAVWTLIELCSCQSLLKPGAIPLVYRFALGTRHRSIARRKPVGAVRYWLRVEKEMCPIFSHYLVFTPYWGLCDRGDNTAYSR
ncbi:hypothetical protein [Kamptonema animale]|jgi:hypothetical protein|uniref:hypothetical protein n=1 Tax=Kamptonema animale TaxID=92934 RepID=UPI00232BA078|nr:hypothetical protein [Kamptonema animale]